MIKTVEVVSDLIPRNRGATDVVLISDILDCICSVDDDPLGSSLLPFITVRKLPKAAIPI